MADSESLGRFPSQGHLPLHQEQLVSSNKGCGFYFPLSLSVLSSP